MRAARPGCRMRSRPASSPTGRCAVTNAGRRRPTLLVRPTANPTPPASSEGPLGRAHTRSSRTRLASESRCPPARCRGRGRRFDRGLGASAHPHSDEIHVRGVTSAGGGLGRRGPPSNCACLPTPERGRRRDGALSRTRQARTRILEMMQHPHADDGVEAPVGEWDALGVPRGPALNLGSSPTCSLAPPSMASDGSSNTTSRKPPYSLARRPKPAPTSMSRSPCGRQERPERDPVALVLVTPSAARTGRGSRGPRRRQASSPARDRGPLESASSSRAGVVPMAVHRSSYTSPRLDARPVTIRSCSTGRTDTARARLPAIRYRGRVIPSELPAGRRIAVTDAIRSGRRRHDLDAGAPIPKRPAWRGPTSARANASSSPRCSRATSSRWALRAALRGRRSPPSPVARRASPARAARRAFTSGCAPWRSARATRSSRRPFSFVASANCLLYERAVPRFVDIEEDSLGLDPDLVEAAAIEPDAGHPAGARLRPAVPDRPDHVHRPAARLVRHRGRLRGPRLLRRRPAGGELRRRRRLRLLPEQADHDRRGWHGGHR